MNKLRDGERFDKLIRENINIIQSKSVFSFSLDAILLADFAKVPTKKSALIVDACSGNGVIAFLLSAKTQCKIYAIEYQEKLVDMAQRTIQYNQLDNKIVMIQGDYKQATQWFKPGTVDVITCNPPYFPVTQQSLKNHNIAYAIARHELMISLKEWIEQSSRLLKMGGKLYCVHRPDRLDEILYTMKEYQLIPKKIQFVHPEKDKNANIVLIEAVKHGKVGSLKILPAIIVFNEHNDYLEPVWSMLYGQ